MDSDYFTATILGPLEQTVFPTGRNPHAKRLTIHSDNRLIHTNRTTEEYITQDHMIRVQHPPCSPDLAPSDCFLFPTIKEKLKDIHMVDEEDLFCRLQDILNSISGKELDQIFGTWINRFMIGRTGNGADMS
jgi:hypothetical protein